MRLPLLGGRITERALMAGIVLTEGELQQLTNYYELLAHWNRTVNLTALDLNGLADQVIDRIITEPIISKGLIDVSQGPWFDLGSGGGSPALPLKILLPEVELTLVESKFRKSAFLREAARHLGLDRVSVWTGRIENMVESFGTDVAQLVTVRGVKLDARVLKTAVELLAGGGRLITFGTETPPPIDAFPLRYRRSTHLLAGKSAIHLFAKASVP